MTRVGQTALGRKIVLAFLRQKDAEAEPALRAVVHGPQFGPRPDNHDPVKLRIFRSDDINGEGFINS